MRHNTYFGVAIALSVNTIRGDDVQAPALSPGTQTSVPHRGNQTQTGPKTLPRLTRLVELLHATAEAPGRISVPGTLGAPRKPRGAGRSAPSRAGGSVGIPFPLVDWHATSGPGWQDPTQAPSMEEKGQTKPPWASKESSTKTRKKRQVVLETCKPAMYLFGFGSSSATVRPRVCRAWVPRDVGRDSFDGPRCKASASGNLSSDHPLNIRSSTRGCVELDQERVTDTYYRDEKHGTVVFRLLRGKSSVVIRISITILCTRHCQSCRAEYGKKKEKNQCPSHRRISRGPVGW